MLGKIIKIGLLVLSVHVIGCRHLTPEESEKQDTKFFISQERQYAKDLGKYLQVGMTEEEVRKVYKAAPKSYTRPQNGWRAEGQSTEVSWPASTFERVHAVKVERCDVFQSYAGQSSMSAIFGLPGIDYVFFDATGKVNGYYHRYISD